MNTKKFFSIFAVLLYTVLFLLFSSNAIETAKSALSLCARSVIPSLFPFFVCSNLLINLGIAPLFSKLFSPLMYPLFGLGGSSALPFLLGLFCGYPVGAKTATDLYLAGGCSKSEAEKLLAFCNNSGPVFVTGAVGYAMLQSKPLGILLFLAQLFSALLIALIMRQSPITISSNHIRKNSQPESSPFGEVFSSAISSSVILTLNVCGFILFFSTIISFADSLGIIGALSSLGINPDVCRAAIYSLLECGGGCNAISSANIPTPLKLILLSAALGWSGLSVHLQVLGIIKKAKLSPKLYFKGKALMTIISPVITFIFYLIYIKVLNPSVLAGALILFSSAAFLAGKVLSGFKKLYSRYAALPPR